MTCFPGLPTLVSACLPSERFRLKTKKTQFSLFPNDSEKMKDEATRAGLNPDGPHTALIIKSDSDEPGECAGIFKRLFRADVNAYK